MAVDIYSPRTMDAMLRQMKGPRSFLLDRLFTGVKTFSSESVDVDIATGARRMAPFTGPRSAGTAVDALGFVTKTYTPPLIDLKAPLSEDHLRKRLAGETLYEGRSPAEREAALVGEMLADLAGMIGRREEWMAARQLEDGELTISGDGIAEYTIDFGRAADQTISLLTAADRWTETTADILGDIREWVRLISKSCGQVADTLVLGESAAKAFLANSTLMTALDVRRVDLGLISPEMTNMPGVTFLGRVKGTAVDVFSYDEWYLAGATGTETGMITTTHAVMFASGARATRYYGAVAVASESGGSSSLNLVEGERVPDAWVQKSPPARIIRLATRSLPAMVQADATLCAQVVAA